MPLRTVVRCAATCALVVAGLGDRAGAQSPGSWGLAFNHEVNTANTNQLTIPITHVWPPRFNAIHMALVPAGPHRGKVLVWDKADVALNPYQRWSIIDPLWTAGSGRLRFRNFFLAMPPTAQTGDLFCAGHVWMQDGRLFVAGGTALYPSGPLGYFGAALTYQFAPEELDPANGDFGVWHRGPDLATTRWYPSVTLLGDDRMLIAGGSDNGVYHNDYEVFRLNGPFGQTPPSPLTWDQRTSGNGNLRVYAGPPAPGGFADYPRVQMLQTGQPFCSGWWRRGFKWTHVPAQNPVYDFTAGAGANSPNVAYATSLLDPRGSAPGNVILRIGGNSSNFPRQDVDHCDAGVPGDWQTYTGAFRLRHARWLQNAVILPDASVFVFGGFADGNNPGLPEYTPELLQQNGWVDQPQHVGPRGYHATAVLLPDGRVFCGGADTRTVDYQIYSPPYLTNGRPRPRRVSCDISSIEGGMRYRSESPEAAYTAWWDENLPSGVKVDKVVMIRPGSITHHSDMDARYIRLPLVVDDDVADSERFIRFRGPADSRTAPRGWYMLFLVTNEGVPSEAIWVHLR